MSYRILIDPRAGRQLESLSEAIIPRIDEAILALAENPRPHGGSDEGVLVFAENYGERFVAHPENAGWGKHPLLRAAIARKNVSKHVALQVTIFSEAPSGASTGTSAAAAGAWPRREKRRIEEGGFRMNAKKMVAVAVKVVALGVLLTVCFIGGGLVSGIARLQPPAQSPATVGGQAPATADVVAAPAPGSSPATPSPAALDPGRVLSILLACSLMQAGVIAYIILRSRWWGWKLIGAVFLALFGVNTVQAGIEAALYLPRQLPPGMVPRLFVMGGFTAAAFSPLAVLILGKMRRQTSDDAPNPRLVMPAAAWVWKCAAIAALYLVVYYSFGYFVAWQNPELRQYYGQTEFRSFLGTLGGIWSHSPWMFPYHAFRGLLFVAFVLPVIRMMKGAWWETALAIALAFSLLGGAQLLLPNPFMPESVARTHFVEVTTSNLLFGGIVGWLLAGGGGSGRADAKRLESITEVDTRKAA